MRILIAEDDRVSNRLLIALLTAEGHEVIATYEGESALEALESEGAPQLAIVDWNMPGLNGPDICRRVRASKRISYVYLIVVTAHREEERTLAALQAGADDFVLKPFVAAELIARLRTGERIIRNEQELRLAHEQLRVLAMHDALTQVWNRGAILQMLEREAERARRFTEPLSICLLDLDHFKRINDEHGHPAGDEVLRETAKRLKATLRLVDGVGRYGGEEFLVVLPNCSQENALVVAERLRRAICEQTVSAGGQHLPVTASFGVCEHFPSIRLDETIAAADRALYTAKREGRNLVARAPIEPALIARTG